MRIIRFKGVNLFSFVTYGHGQKGSDPHSIVDFVDWLGSI